MSRWREAQRRHEALKEMRAGAVNPVTAEQLDRAHEAALVLNITEGTPEYWGVLAGWMACANWALGTPIPDKAREAKVREAGKS